MDAMRKREVWELPPATTTTILSLNILRLNASFSKKGAKQFLCRPFGGGQGLAWGTQLVPPSSFPFSFQIPTLSLSPPPDSTCFSLRIRAKIPGTGALASAAAAVSGSKAKAE